MRLIQTLCQLYALDREWDEKVRIYQSIVQRITDQSERDTVRETQRRRTEELATNRSALQDAELELDSLSQKAAEVDKSLYGGGVISPKELDSLRQDAERLKSHISDLEDQILEGITQVEQLEADAREGQQELQTFEERWTQEHEELAAQYKELRARLQEVQKQRDELRAGLDTATLSLYDELRAKKAGMALAPMKAGVCQVCHVTMPSYKARSVDRSEGVITCEGCGRILYSA